MKGIEELRIYLNNLVIHYNNPQFIADDPISVPHRFSKLQDIEIAGFFAAIFAWGNRTTIIAKSKELMQLMGNAPHQFCLQHSEKELKQLSENQSKQQNNLTQTDNSLDKNNLKEYYNLLPKIDNFLRKFRKIERVGIRYIVSNNGIWTLRLLGLLRDPRRIFSEWAVHFTSVLSHDYGIEKCIKMNFHNDPDLMYKTVTESQEFIDRTYIRKEYRKWRKKEIKIQARIYKEKSNNEVKKSNNDNCFVT